MSRTEKTPECPHIALHQAYNARYGFRGQQQAAKDIGVSPQYLGDLLKGKRAISPQVALKLEKAWGGIDAEDWLILQVRWDLWQLRQKEETA
jgi:addiction module HigA family antidote